MTHNSILITSVVSFERRSFQPRRPLGFLRKVKGTKYKFACVAGVKRGGKKIKEDNRNVGRGGGGGGVKASR